MATVKFLIKGKSNPSTIYVRFRDGRKSDYTVSTTKTINPSYWGKMGIKKIANFKDKLNLSNDLINLKSLIERKRNETVTSQIVINREWLESIILEWKGENTDELSDFLTDRIEAYKKLLPTKVRNGKVGVAKGTIRNLTTTKKRLEKFETHKKTKYRITEIDFTFHEQYIKHAQQILGLSLNSIGKDIKHFKTVCTDSQDKGFKVNPQVLSRNFNAPSEKTIFTTLNETELRAIKEKDFKGVDYLENARDWLIIGCWTGCRVGDLMKLNKDNVMIHPSGAKFIQYVQNKGGKTVNVPLHQNVQDIINRRESFPRPISDQKFNDYIKIVCKKVGLRQRIDGTKQNKQTHLKEVGVFEKWELIRSHTCRRSFATNHYNKLPNKLIMAVTGHATERMLLNYIGEVENDHIQDYMQFWTEQQEGQAKKINPSKKIG